MTLGKKLSGYRKLAGLTQQQLGERLSLSAQAISKWENDLAEPDLSALRTLSELYKVSVDELLNLNDDSFENVLEDEPHAPESEKVENVSMLGFCNTCGIMVTGENLGTTEPVVMCKKCLDAKIEADRLAEERRIEEEKNQIIAAENAKKDTNYRTKQKLTRTFVLAGIVTAAFIAICIYAAGAVGIAVGLVGGYVVFAYISCLCLDTIVNEVFFDWAAKSFQAPGLIFTFDLDGILWLIGMKLLFWALGVLLCLICALFGILLGLVLAPFDFIYVMVKIKRDYAIGAQSEYIEY